MSVSTSRSGFDANGDLFVYAPPGVTAVDRGWGVAYGAYNPVSAGDQATLAGVVQFASGSGQMQVTEGGSLTYRLVTIAAGPPTAPALAGQPLVTGRVGVNAAGVSSVYRPPYVITSAVGMVVTFGAWVTLEEFQVLPAAPVIIEVQAGASPAQAMNQVVWRQVTLTPL